MHIELANPLSWSVWSVASKSAEVIAEFESACPDTDSLFLIMPLHEDFYDFAKSYCEQYKEYILNKIK